MKYIKNDFCFVFFRRSKSAMSDSDSFHSQEDVEQNYEQGEFLRTILKIHRSCSLLLKTSHGSQKKDKRQKVDLLPR